ncbi:MAG: hypothetical protein AB7N90_18640, partial [Vicinamibacterales bacterium]
VLEVDGDFFIIDFEGEPARPLAERRALQSPLKDVAGMLRSLSYAAQSGLRQFLRSRPDMTEALAPWAAGWEREMSRVFLDGYHRVMADAGLLPASEAAQAELLDIFVLDKLVYELGYELGNRPTWVEIPLDALLSLVDPGWAPPSAPAEENGAPGPEGTERA